MPVATEVYFEKWNEIALSNFLKYNLFSKTVNLHQRKEWKECCAHLGLVSGLQFNHGLQLSSRSGDLAGFFGELEYLGRPKYNAMLFLELSG